VALSLTQTAGLVITASTWNNREPSTTASAVFSFLAGLALVGLLQLEHVRSIRPSFIVSVYLLVSAFLDISRVRTAWLRGASTGHAVTLSFNLGFKLFILMFETVEKRRLLPKSDKDISIESTSGPFNRGLFVWLNSLLRAGFTNLLTLESLPSINERLATDKIHHRFDTAWKQGKTWPSGLHGHFSSIYAHPTC
jgi:ATP-binding cassette, subfamily C (CFTR/MRP), member 1